MKIKDLKIGVRLGLGFGLVFLLVALITTVGVVRLQQVAGATDRMESATEKMLLAKEWMGGTLANSIRTHAIARSNDPDLDSYYQKALDEESARLAEIQKNLSALATSEEAKRLMALTSENRTAYIAVRKKIIDFKASGREMGAGALKTMIEKDLHGANLAYLNAMQQLVDHHQKAFDAEHAAVQGLTSSSKTLMLAVGLGVIAMGSLFAWLISQSITRPLSHAVKVARTVATGNLCSRIEDGNKDETGQLLSALKEMNDSLLKSVTEVRGGTHIIATASQQIASGNMELSSRTEQQASALEETASSMEELTSTVKKNADNVHRAILLANSASEVAGKGSVIMAEVVQTMDGINDSSRKVSDIISVIDGIAFQTNILALNAAVEAARAGEQGRGFAVVAAEVRHLAQRSASAAKDIKTLIDGSANQVADGSKLVAEAGTTMDHIMGSIGQVTQIMTEIGTATVDQSSGIEQINRAIGQMNQMTQQNTALVEEASAGAQSLQDQATNLAEAVEFFQLADASSAPATGIEPSRAALPGAPSSHLLLG